MKKTLLLLSVLAAGSVLAGCSNDHIMHMKDGSTVVVQGKPKIDDATGMVLYTDENGKEQAVNQNNIKDMNSIND
ncbi:MULTISPECIES: YgdI/YgdR family lipoprotein [Erwinia]|uniref:YgdI/YgdR family lipoprotein n=1 Tax=Erwinia TaxID=551 RepID=UPI000554A887|nr:MULTISPECIES: YgdI/YgdR family lipoprotein [Erwinia]